MPWPTIVYIAAAVTLDGAAALVGGLIPERVLVVARRPLVGFAAGVMLGTTFLDLLPEALERAGGRGGVLSVLVAVLASLLLMFLLEWAMRGRPQRRGAGLAGVLLGADAFHNVADGAAIAAAFFVSPRLGLVTSIAVIAHEVPEELADYVFLRQGGMSRRRAMLAMTAVQLTAGFGALGTAVGASLWKGASGIVLAVAAGTFLHIVEVDLLPLLLDAGEARQGPATLAAMGCGVALSILGMGL